MEKNQTLPSLKQIKASGKLSPGIINGKVVSFLFASGDQYYIKFEDQFLKDAKGAFEKIKREDAIQARIAYISADDNFENEIQSAIAEEILSLQHKLKERAGLLSKVINTYDNWRRNIQDDIAKQLALRAFQADTETLRNRASRFFANCYNAMDFSKLLYTAANLDQFYRLIVLLNVEIDSVLSYFIHDQKFNFTELFDSMQSASDLQTDQSAEISSSPLYQDVKNIILETYYPAF